MKILILHQFVNHNKLVNALCKNLNEQEVETDSFNISTWQFDSLHNKLPLYITILKKVLFHYRLKLLLLKFFPNFFNVLFKKYTIIDIHFFGSFYFKTIDLLKKINKKVKITIWGSDFYRATNTRKEQQRVSYKKVDCIQIATEQMKVDFLEYYNEFENKIRLAHFGIIQFDVLAKISNTENINTTKDTLSLPQNKLIITCGSNGIVEQQHLSIFSAFQDLNEQLKKEIFLLIPMTNGFDELYKSKLEKELNSLGVVYKILTDNLSTEDICRLRLATDIAVNIQITDAFSASIQEHIYSKNILIVGDWLPYNKLEENDIFYIKTTIQKLQQNLIEVITNIEKYKEKSKTNTTKIDNISSWKAVTKDWVKIYTKIS